MDKRLTALTYILGAVFLITFLGLSIFDAVNKDFEINGGLWLGPLTIILGSMFGGIIGIQIIKKHEDVNGSNGK